MTLDWNKIQEKWNKRWVKEEIFAANVDKKRKKFFVTFPYPYVNSIPHIGHFYTLMRVEAFARYKRMQGFNVLFPQGWHATGSPIVSAANRIKEKEPKQIKILLDIGIAKKDIKKFEDPAYWIKYFVPQALQDYQAMGISIDWRRQFYTTSLNPHYDKFIRWQFNKLKEKKKVIKGKFPVVWCPKCNNAVGDHSRSEGEGETTQEFTLVKHKLDQQRFIVSATLRPDTILGITNLYVHPKIEYVEAEVDSEIWIISKTAAERLKEQKHQVKIKSKILGEKLIGKKTEEFDGRKVLILPATFLEEDFGTGLVHSVPSDSADDLIALWDLQKDEETLKKFNLNVKEVKAIKPIAILKTPGYSDIASEDFLKKYQIKSQHEKKKLEQIRKELYKLSHYSATLNHLYKNHFSKNLEGYSVEKGKEIIKTELIEKGWAILYYELTGKVVCRCLTKSIVKIVEDQWFLAYGDEEWKKEVHKAFKKIKLYPEKARAQFDYVIDWLHNWACTRESGLGTRLPWDEKWLIESLSDSTIYMAYYTIAHLIKDIDAKLIDDNLFDFVFLNKNVKVKIEEKLAKQMKEEFNYWYPVDFRNSGKDLIQNHLTFFVFNHTAIFKEKHWPQSIGVNGWVTVDGEKMSKSLGNIIPLREMPQKFGVDCARFTILSGGEEIDDPNWDSNFATALKSKLEQFYTFCLDNYNKGRSNYHEVDKWMESELNQIIEKTTQYMEKTLFRSALQTTYFELSNTVKWYLRRCDGNFNKEIITKIIETQLKMLAPVTPFICEEIWEKIGKKDLLSSANWPQIDKKKIIPKLNLAENLIKQTLTDFAEVKKLAKVDKPKKVTLLVSLPWKYELFNVLTKLDSRNPGLVLKEVMKNNNLKKYGKEISKFVPKLVQSGRVPSSVSSEKEEYNSLMKAKEFLESELACQVEIIKASKSDNPKGRTALPGKVGILVE